ncbi:MAG: hypothetical protein U0746_23175 [Gemmataceae bacterium]
MNKFDNDRGFTAVPADELMQVEGGFSIGGLVRGVVCVIKAVIEVLTPRPPRMPPRL